MKRHGAVRSIFGSLQYTPSFYEDFVARRSHWCTIPVQQETVGWFQNWIVTKIEELSACRNLVAHNSYLEEHQRSLVKVYYTNILIQLNSTLRELVAKV